MFWTENKKANPRLQKSEKKRERHGTTPQKYMQNATKSTNLSKYSVTYMYTKHNKWFLSLAWSRDQYNWTDNECIIRIWHAKELVLTNDMRTMVTHPYMTFDLALLGSIYVQVPKDHLYQV